MKQAGLRAVGQRRLGLAAVGLIVIASPMLPVSTALATNVNGSCESGEVCAYRDSGLTNSVFDHSAAVSQYSSFNYFNTSVSPAGRTSSIWSRGTSSWRVRVYENINGTGKVACYDPGESSSNLPDSTKGTLGNDSADSHYWSTTACT